MSQSLFYWKPLCNIITGLDRTNHKTSQSLFYWKPLCNTNLPKGAILVPIVTILILLETSLQSKMENPSSQLKSSHNPYFTGNLFAIDSKINVVFCNKTSQSLFYWKPLCN